MLNFNAILIPFIYGLVLEIAYQIGRYRRERDIVEYFKRFLSRHKSKSALEDLISGKAGLEKYHLIESWPFYFIFFKKPTYDLKTFNQIVEEAIDEAKKATDIKQIKQKLSVSDTKIEDIILKNYKYNITQLGFYLFIVSRFAFGYAAINLFSRFFNLLSSLLTF